MGDTPAETCSKVFMASDSDILGAVSVLRVHRPMCPLQAVHDRCVAKVSQVRRGRSVAKVTRSVL